MDGSFEDAVTEVIVANTGRAVAARVGGMNSLKKSVVVPLGNS